MGINYILRIASTNHIESGTRGTHKKLRTEIASW